MKGLSPDLITSIEAGIVKHVIYPHQLFKFIWEHYPEEIVRCLGADETRIQQFWEGFLITPAGRKLRTTSPALIGKSPPELRRVIPLVFL